ncbi:PREDICTED: GPI ethanolamine phosphate transferase 3 [Nicrophorus vespilloides]|uniref:GPI ethanolamine phosphate transferase 3 n=1 Tax=Nicrophorus vespilloides TaxID=110193 RepID=A0ABM1NB23_NICVS|nr:PREDICTED: GPI ethanolamine phosphate transferase 3 [Nicrophorus vespilloides]
MSKQWYYVLFLLWFTFTAVTQILLFTNGFLLTRVTLKLNSSCDQQLKCDSEPQCENLLNKLDDATTTCLAPRSKVVLLIIDAFRYDFALYNASLSDPLPYQNKLPIISEMINSEPQNTRLYQFIADPPTTTMQRLKGLTTGSLPTFVDAGSNFATHEIDEDNIIDQIHKHGYNAVFMGDDTWDGLYPNRFIRNFPYPSFDVWDLDTVDNGVISNLFDEIQKDDWHLIIGHFLGVDHCGHRYGPYHNEMSRKLSEMNTVIRNVINSLDKESMLFVIGDHGMTATGDHGGESDNEITSTMFVYSKQQLTDSKNLNNYTIKQVDFVPTLSTILGVPIPFSNLGATVLDVLPVVKSVIPNWHKSLFALWANAQQLTAYIKTYANNTRTFNKQDLDNVFEDFEKLKVMMQSVTDEILFAGFVKNVNDYIKNVRNMCEKVWIQFDAYSMARGLLLFSHSIIFIYLLVNGLGDEKFDQCLNKFVIGSLYGLTLVGAIASFILLYFNIVSDFYNTFYFISGLCNLGVLIFLCVQNFQEISLSLNESNKTRKWNDIVSRILLTFSALMLFSNSFILEEAKVMLFFLCSLIVTFLLEFGFLNMDKVNVKSSVKRKIVILGLAIGVLIRFSMYFWKCREEQGCKDYFASKVSNVNRIEWILAFICLVIFIVATKIWLRSCGNLNGFSSTVVLARYSPPLIILCTIGFWVVHKLPRDTRIKIIGRWSPDTMAWIVYGFTFFGILSTIIKPLCIYRLKPNQLEVDMRSDNLIPQLAKHVMSAQPKKDDVPLVFGLATVYSAAFTVVAVYLILLWCLLLGDLVMPSCIALVFVLALVLVISSVRRYEQADCVESLFEVPSSLILFWFVMSIYLFYGTAHQPTFTNIAWDAAFVGTGGTLNYKLIPAALVLINTFGSYLITGITLPLLMIAPFSTHVMLPSLFNKKKGVNLARGELVIYDYDQAFLRGAFKMSCKYIMCHALRVFSSMLSSTIHCRHLMVWNIFAPKLIFEAIAMFITLVSVVLGYLLIIRINNKVDHLIKQLNKQYS